MSGRASNPVGAPMLIVLVLTVGMCVVSGVLAVRKVRSADPADLF